MPRRRDDRVRYEVFSQACLALGLTPTELCGELHVAPGAHGEWRRAGTVPFLVALGVEALRRRQGEAARGAWVKVDDLPRAVELAERRGALAAQLQRTDVAWTVRSEGSGDDVYTVEVDERVARLALRAELERVEVELKALGVLL